VRRSGNKLIKSLFVLIFAIGLAGASTYAWISNNNSAQLEGFNLDISSNNSNLLISLNGEDGSYRAKLTSNDVKDYLTDKYGADFYLTPATSVDGVSITDIDGSPSENYVSIDLYFQSNIKQDIFLNPTQNTTFVSSQRKPGANGPYVKAWKDIAKNEYGIHDSIAKGEDVIALAQNAVRVSFIGDNAVIWTPNPNKGFSGDVNYNNASAFSSKNLAADYLNDVFGYNLEVPEFYLEKNFSENYYDSESGNYIITDKLLTLEYDDAKEVYSGKLTINIWAEGWDGDCFDSIAKDILTIGLQFKTLVVVAE